MILRVDRIFYLKDHPLGIWRKGDVSAIKIRSWSKCCEEAAEILNAREAGLDRRGKLWLYLINPADIDYGSTETMVEWRFCPSCGERVEFVDNIDSISETRQNSC